MLTSVFVLALVLVLPAFGVDDLKPHAVMPKEGLVPNEQNAIAIAVAIWRSPASARRDAILIASESVG